MLGPKHHPNRADPISEFMQDHGERHDPADLTACLKGSANGNAIEKAVHPDARGSPGSGLTGMIVVRRMILYLAMVRGVLEQIEKQKPQGAGEEEMVMMKATMGRLQQLQSVRNDIQQSASNQRAGTEGQHKPPVRPKPQGDESAA